MKLRLLVFVLGLLLHLSSTSTFAQSTRESPDPDRTSGQGLRSLTNAELLELLQQRRGSRSGNAARVTGVRGRTGSSCGFDLAFETIRRMESADRGTIEALRAAFAPTPRQTYQLTPSGLIEIHFDTVGVHAPAMLDSFGDRIEGSAGAFVDHIGHIVDSVYQQYELMGYRTPSPPTGASRIPITVTELNGDPYGQVYPGLPRPNAGTVQATYECALEIDNDFREYRTSGLDGARVTVAHEFFHWIQLSEYGFWKDDQWMYEMTATAMEPRLYPWLRDYHSYVREYLQSPSRAIYAWPGYQPVLHAVYLHRRFGDACLRNTWEGMRSVAPFPALSDAVAAEGADYAQVFCQWSETLYYTGYRAADISPPTYEHAAEFPTVRFNGNLNLSGNAAEFTETLMPMASMFFRVHRGLDTVSVLVNNADISAAEKRSMAGISFRLTVRGEKGDGEWLSLDNGWSYRLESTQTLCVRVLDGGMTFVEDKSLPFPNPFHPNGSNSIHFPLPRNIAVNRANLQIFSPSMNLVFAAEAQEIKLDALNGATFTWDGKTAQSEMAPSGVYFYRLSWSESEKIGKFAVIRR